MNSKKNENKVNQDLLNQWYKLAFNDFKAAKSLLKEENLLIATFHLQQTLEKLFKMYFILSKREEPPFLHNLLQIATEANLLDQLDDEKKDLINTLNPFYIKARYPTYKKSLSDSLDFEKVRYLIDQTTEVIEWLKQKMMQLGWQPNL